MKRFETFQKSPTRVDLAGGTLDCWPLYLFLNHPVTVNVAIDIFTSVELREVDSPSIELHSDDIGAHKTYENLDECLRDQDPAFELIRAQLRYWHPKKGFYLKTHSDSPVGGGLGGSSSLCLSLIKAFQAWHQETMELNDVVRLASHIEAQVLRKPTGTQDYYPALLGGLCMIRYGVEGPMAEVRPIDQSIFADRFLLVYTGRSHHSGINNWQVIKSWLDGDKKTQNALAKLAEISSAVEQALLNSRADELPKLFQSEYEARTELSDGFSSPEIKRLASLAQANGAIAKICGAGGGGCVLIWCQNRNAKEVARAIEKEGFRVLQAQPHQLEASARYEKGRHG